MKSFHLNQVLACPTKFPSSPDPSLYLFLYELTKEFHRETPFRGSMEGNKEKHKITYNVHIGLFLA